MEILALTPYLGLLISLFTAAALIKNNLTSGEKGLDERLKKVEGKLIEHDRRIQTAQSDIEHLPDREITHRLEISLTEISGRLNTLDERLKPIAATSGRLQEYLLEQAKHEH